MSHKLGRLKLDPICFFVSQLKYIVFHCLWRFKTVGRVTITAVRICTLGLRCHKWVVKPIKDLVKTSAKATNCFRYVSSPFFLLHTRAERKKKIETQTGKRDRTSISTAHPLWKPRDGENSSHPSETSLSWSVYTYEYSYARDIDLGESLSKTQGVSVWLMYSKLFFRGKRETTYPREMQALLKWSCKEPRAKTISIVRNPTQL